MRSLGHFYELMRYKQQGHTSKSSSSICMKIVFVDLIRPKSDPHNEDSNLSLVVVHS